MATCYAPLCPISLYYVISDCSANRGDYNVVMPDNPIDESLVFRIQLSDDNFAIVGLEDAVELCKFQWKITNEQPLYLMTENGRQQYGVRSKRYAIVQTGRSILWMHQYIAKLHGETISKGQCVDHINGDSLDNRWSNLRVTTSSENGWWKGIYSGYPSTRMLQLSESIEYYYSHSKSFPYYYSDSRLEACCAFCIDFATKYGHDHIALEHFPELREAVALWRQKGRILQEISTRSKHVAVIHRDDGSYYYATDFVYDGRAKYTHKSVPLLIHATATDEVSCVMNLWREIAKSERHIDQSAQLMFDIYPELTVILEEYPTLVSILTSLRKAVKKPRIRFYGI